MRSVSIVSVSIASASIAASGIATSTLAAAVPNVVGGMRHAMVRLEAGAISVEIDDPSDPLTGPVALNHFPGETYDAGGVLNDTYYADRYGWMADGFITLDPGQHVWVEALSTTPGLRAYAGGMRSNRANHSYAPILGTDGGASAWMWSGMMTHNWYAADMPGVYSALYRVFVGDDNAEPIPGFTDATVSFEFIAVPSPSACMLAGAAMLYGLRRRR